MTTHRHTVVDASTHCHSLVVVCMLHTPHAPLPLCPCYLRVVRSGQPPYIHLLMPGTTPSRGQSSNTLQTQHHVCVVLVGQCCNTCYRGYCLAQTVGPFSIDLCQLIGPGFSCAAGTSPSCMMSANRKQAAKGWVLHHCSRVPGCKHTCAVHIHSVCLCVHTCVCACISCAG